VNKDRPLWRYERAIWSPNENLGKTTLSIKLRVIVAGLYRVADTVTYASQWRNQKRVGGRDAQQASTCSRAERLTFMRYVASYPSETHMRTQLTLYKSAHRAPTIHPQRRLHHQLQRPSVTIQGAACGTVSLRRYIVLNHLRWVESARGRCDSRFWAA